MVTIFSVVLLQLCIIPFVSGYRDDLYGLITIQKPPEGFSCKPMTSRANGKKTRKEQKYKTTRKVAHAIQPIKAIVATTERNEQDPIKYFDGIINNVLYGNTEEPKDTAPSSIDFLYDNYSYIDTLAIAPSGNVMRGELFLNKSGVHLPSEVMMHRGHCYLRLTYDYMQTAINAFAILLYGDVDDVLRLPPEYVLSSARTISMMKIEREKLVATWSVIKGEYDTSEITYEILEMYRPLFKYLSGREIAKLNLSDPKILSFVGTHTDLNRHQMGVVASRYIEMNKKWREPKYLNLMNNLLCGVPMTFMRRVAENIYLQLSNQLFFHIRACDPLQRRFYLAMMSRTQVLGKSNSWRARDVARLGLLLTEVDGPDLSSINPEAFVGFSAQVMTQMSPTNLVYITDKQLAYLNPKARNILANKIKQHFEEIEVINAGSHHITTDFIIVILIACSLK